MSWGISGVRVTTDVELFSRRIGGMIDLLGSGSVRSVFLRLTGKSTRVRFFENWRFSDTSDGALSYKCSIELPGRSPSLSLWD